MKVARSRASAPRREASPRARHAGLVALALIALLVGRLDAQTTTATTGSVTQPTSQPTTQPTTQPARDVVAAGTDERVWVGVTIANSDRNTPGQRTILRTRGTGDGQRWTLVTELPTPVQSLATRGSEAIAVLPDQSWQLISGTSIDTTIRTGRPLPEEAELIALAGDGNQLWAIGYGPPPRSDSATSTTSATRASIQPATATAANRAVEVEATPKTAPAPRLQIYRLDSTQWTSLDTLPLTVRRDALWPLAFAIVAHQPTFAAPSSDGRLHVFQLRAGSSQGGWIDRTLPPLGASLRDVTIVDNDDQVVLFATSRTGRVTMAQLGVNGQWTMTDLGASPTTMPADRAITEAFGQIMSYTLDTSGKLLEQPLDDNGKPTTQPIIVDAPEPADLSRVVNIINIGVMVLLTWVMVIALRRRGKLQQVLKRVDELSLAPFGPRFAAGVIDSVPMIAMILIFAIRADVPVEELEGRVLETDFQIWMLWSIGAYLLYTTATEAIFKRSVGKMLFGLRIVDLEGKSPDLRAILYRNLLRVIDLVLLFPIAMVLFSPLRQRVGDLAAGTIVIRPAVATKTDRTDRDTD